MKFRIVRDLDLFQPQVYDGFDDWHNIVEYSLSTIEEARQACSAYKKMMCDPIVEEFEL